MSVQTIQISNFSDGDASKTPGTGYSASSPDLYLKKLAIMWVKDMEVADPDKKYILDRLPDHYRVFEKARLNQPHLRDRYLFGHPRGKVFDSPAQFYPHFKSLMDHQPGTELVCPCKGCDVRRPGTGRVKRTEATVDFLTPRDGEGSPDVYATLIKRLADEKYIDEPIIENASMDWRATRDSIPATIRMIAGQRSFVPRQGELVLFLREKDCLVELDAVEGGYKLYRKSDRQCMGVPAWEAGVVTRVPKEPISFDDLTGNTKRTSAIAQSAFKIERFPDPNSQEKGLTRQYDYVPLSLIRPLSLWGEYMEWDGVRRVDETVKNALKVTSSIALVERNHFSGVWPEAVISCRGAWIGAELIVVGDAIRLLPEDDGQPFDTALVVSAINLSFISLDDPGTVQATVLFSGLAYTTDRSKAFADSPVLDDELAAALPSGMGRRVWYPKSAPGSELFVPVEHVGGRCFESDALFLWLGRETAIDFGRQSIGWARSHSARVDSRIEPGQKWFWANHRAEQLDLQSVNGNEVGSADGTRQPSTWRRVLRVIDGVDAERRQVQGARGNSSGNAAGSGQDDGSDDMSGGNSSDDEGERGGEPIPDHLIDSRLLAASVSDQQRPASLPEGIGEMGEAAHSGPEPLAKRPRLTSKSSPIEID
ncbi:MAG: hypothetical protein M1825_000488 [Sarcosagium campestre]|nr:MAG: hypothetical protein M1825_000488 [Sarcosagium campestre]